MNLNFPKGAGPQGHLQLENPQQGGSSGPHRSQGGSEAQDAGHAPADPGVPLPLAFVVRLWSPTGGRRGLAAALMEPLQLRFSRQLLVGPYSSVIVSVWGCTSMMDVCVLP